MNDERLDMPGVCPETETTPVAAGLESAAPSNPEAEAKKVKHAEAQKRYSQNRKDKAKASSLRL